jgi:lysophospholipase L1-like esterase
MLMQLSERYQNLSRKKKLFFWVVVNIALLVSVEGMVRVGYFLATENTYYLTYGRHDRNWGAYFRTLLDSFPGYYKFKPQTFMTKGNIPAHINQHGFRGPEFSEQKSTDIVRVMTLGESSTFGFNARDEHTYPAELQKLLNANRLCGRRWEVINAGMPWIRSDQIEALFIKDVIRYTPDVVTIYAGRNDAVGSVDPDASEIEKARLGFNMAKWWERRTLLFTESTLWLRGKLLVLNEAVEVLKKLIHHVPSKEKLKDLYMPPVVDKSTVENEMQIIARHYGEHIRNIIRHAKSAGIQIVLVSQPVRIDNQYASVKDFFELSDISDGDMAPRKFSDQYQRILKKLDTQGFIYDFETSILRVHANTEKLKALSEEQAVPFLDFFPAVDSDPDLLVTTVHLSEEGNRRLARQLYETFVRYELGCVARSGADMVSLDR